MSADCPWLASWVPNCVNGWLALFPACLPAGSAEKPKKQRKPKKEKVGDRQWAAVGGWGVMVSGHGQLNGKVGEDQKHGRGHPTTLSAQEPAHFT